MFVRSRDSIGSLTPAQCHVRRLLLWRLKPGALSQKLLQYMRAPTAIGAYGKACGACPLAGRFRPASFVPQSSAPSRRSSNATAPDAIQPTSWRPTSPSILLSSRSFRAGTCSSQSRPKEPEVGGSFVLLDNCRTAARMPPRMAMETSRWAADSLTDPSVCSSISLQLRPSLS
jgi:hypothetical protein